MEQSARRAIATPLFEYAVTMLVVASAVLIGLEAYDYSSDQSSEMIAILDGVILAGFVGEIVLRFVGDWSHPGRFFRRPWNVFDLGLVVGALIPLTAGFAGVLRMVRVLRVMRIVGRLPRLRLLLTTTILSIPSLFSIALLLGVLFYTYAAAGVFLFSDNDPIHFANPHTSFMSLFRVITLEDWTDIMYTQIYGCENYGYADFPELCTSSNEFGAWGAVFFMSFVFLGSFIVLNLFVGIIIIGMDEARAQVRRQDLIAGREIQPLMSERDSELHLLSERLEDLQEMVAVLLHTSQTRVVGVPEPNESLPADTPGSVEEASEVPSDDGDDALPADVDYPVEHVSDDPPSVGEPLSRM